MALIRAKDRRVWRVCAAACALAGLVWWAMNLCGELEGPVRAPALEVSEERHFAAAPPPRREKFSEYTVRPGDTVAQIAAAHGIDVDTLLGANEGLTERIQPGDRLRILPKPGVLYRAEQGDSIWRIARQFQVDERDILRENGKADAFLAIGEQLFIPGAKPLRSAAGRGAVSRGAEAKFILPATGVVSSPFGRRWGRLHKGMDIADDEGTPIAAALGGEVVHAGWISGYGYAVILAHRRGYSTLYGHMREVLTQRGAVVRQGQTIGRMGSTGNSTGPHVHFEVLKDGVPIDPVGVLR